MNETERVEIIQHCKWVDEVLCPCPWVITVDFLRDHNIHYVAHDDLPYGSVGQTDIYYDVKRLGMFRATQRTEGISTSDIILRIIKDYDMYVERSLSRGYKREDIGISQVKEFRIKFSNRIKELQSKLVDKDSVFNKYTPGKRGGLNNMFNELFHNLEFNTETFWRDFAKQYRNASKNHQIELSKRNKRESEFDEEAESEHMPSEVPTAPAKDQRTWWQRTYHFVLEQLEMDGARQEEHPESNEEDSDDIEDI